MDKTTGQLTSVDTIEDTSDERKERIATIDYKMVTFSLAGKDYAIDIMKVKEIAKAGRFTFVPNTAGFVLGVYNLRGDIIPIVDLRLFFNIPVEERKGNELENMIIVSVEEQTFGVVVDAIDKVVGIQRASIQPPHPLFGDINIKYIYGVVESNNRLYILLDIDRIFGLKQHTAEGEVKPQNDADVKAPDGSEDDVPSLPKNLVKEETKKNEASSVKEQTDFDYNFVVEGLAGLKKFYVTDINEAWVKSRYNQWTKERGIEKTQLVNEEDANLFLSSFFSPHTASFWSKSYAESMYKALPENSAKQINVWNPGCGKGYESFSLACLLKKRYPESRIRIYAHDIDLLSVSNAQLLTVPPPHDQDWYAPFLTSTVSGEKTFSAEIKEMIFFEYHDCANTSAMPNVDIIFCRDVLSLMPQDKQNSVFEDFEEKLKGNGIMILGANEILTNRVNWSEKEYGSVTVYTKQ